MNVQNTANISYKYQPWLDTMRFIAAFLVLFSHSRNDFFVPFDQLPPEQRGLFAYVFYFLGRLGHEAVIVFFVLSGFLVGGRGLERIKNDSFQIGSYCIDRTVRIGIPLITSIILFIIVSLCMGTPVHWIDALGNLFSLQGLLVDNLVSPFWSLSYEVWFYILLLSIALVFKKQMWGFPLLILCYVVFSIYNPVYLFMWFMGAFAYITKPDKRNRFYLWSSLFMIGVMVVLSQFASDSNAINFPFKPNASIIELILGFFMCTFVQQAILFEPQRRFTKIIDSTFSYLASFSYTLYLAHRILMVPLFEYIYPSEEGTLTAADLIIYTSLIILILFLCWLLYMISERYTKQIKTFIKQKVLN